VKAKDVMCRAVVTVRPYVRVGFAADMLAEHGLVSAPVVTAEGILCGMVSAADLLRTRSDGSATEAGSAVTVLEVMTPQPVTVRPGDDLTEVAAVLLDHGVRTVPVVEHDRLVGIVSRHDVERCVAKRPAFAATAL
jgi:CBS domain-containing protein